METMDFLEHIVLQKWELNHFIMMPCFYLESHSHFFTPTGLFYTVWPSHYVGNQHHLDAPPETWWKFDSINWSLHLNQIPALVILCTLSHQLSSYALALLMPTLFIHHNSYSTKITISQISIIWHPHPVHPLLR